MAYSLNRKICDLKPYDPIQGNYRIRLDANESFLPVPTDLMDGILRTVEETLFHRYPDSLATQVSVAFAEYYGVEPASVTVGNGSDELISVILSAFLMKGERVMTLSHDFSMYHFYASIAEAETITVEKNEDLTIPVDRIIQTAKEQDVKLIIFSNPCNPTSLGLSREDVRRIIRSTNALVVLDEAYMDFWDQSLLHEVGEYDNLMILRTCSKAFGMAAIRLGFAVANPVLTNALKAVKSPYNSNTLTQAVGAKIFSRPERMRENLRQILRSKEELFEMLKQLQVDSGGKICVYDSCTNFVFLKTDASEEIYQHLLNNSIAIRLFPQGYLRITAGTPEENQALISAMRGYVLEGDNAT